MPKLLGGIFSRRNQQPDMAVKLERGCYAMASYDGIEAEITMYGEVVKKRPTDWYDNPVKGDYIVLSEFLDDLKTIEGAQKIFIRLDSVGGAVYSALSIYNRLMELKAEITIQVDGVAMSAASVIMCAADHVIVHPTSIIMIHTASAILIGYYNTQELDKARGELVSADTAMLAAYRKKTGMSNEELAALMEAETFMVGEEAVEKGFADELLDDDEIEIAASADRYTIYAGDRIIRLPENTKLPENINIPTVSSAKAVGINKKLPADPGSNKGGKPMAKLKTIDELKAEYPELTEQLEAQARAAATAAPTVPATPATPAANADAATPTGTPATDSEAVANAERERLKAIDAIAASINDPVLVAEAKYGTTRCTAAELALRALQKQAAQGADHLSAVQADYNASGAADVSATPGAVQQPGSNPKAEAEAQAKADAEARKKLKEGK